MTMDTTDNPNRDQAPMGAGDDMTAEIEEGTESVRRTIVGGRPIDRRRRKVRIPIGVEKVLYRAAADRVFREQLLMGRAEALPGTGLEVSGAEAMILRSVSDDALRTMIEAIDVKRHRKRRFFRGIAAASLAATTALGTASCGEEEMAVAGGAAPDWPDAAGDSISDVMHPDRIEQDLLPPVDAGSWPELPPDEITPLDVPDMTAGVDIKDPDVVEGHDGFAPGGVMPDMVDDPDVIDSEVAMDGGMWGDDVEEEK